MNLLLIVGVGLRDGVLHEAEDRYPVLGLLCIQVVRC